MKFGFQRSSFFKSIALLSGVVLLLAYNNCAKSSTKGEVGTGSQTPPGQTFNAADVCKEQDIEVFSKGYHQFLSTSCKTCHVSGPGRGTFAHPDKAIAYDAFSNLGFEKISNYAVSGSHNLPYTGPQNTDVVNQMRTQWQAYLTAKAKCSGSTSPTIVQTFTPEYETTTLSIPRSIGSATGAYPREVLKWDLGTTLSSLKGKAMPNLSGVELSMTVTGYKTASGETAYLFTMPTLKVAGNSLNVKGLNLRLNGFPVRYATTFKVLDSSVYQNTAAMLSPGSLVSVGPYTANDTLALQLGSIEIVNMPPPPPLPAVQFAVGAMTLQRTNLGYANKVPIQVTVTGENLNAISVGVSSGGPNDYPAGEISAASVVGTDYNRFDWDYRVDPATPLAITFSENQKVASFNLIFSDDLRAKGIKTLRLKLGTPLGGSLGGNRVLVITIPNLNPPYSGIAPTFTQLMNKDSGILGRYCIKCHNSVLKEGGYDMTDYQQMVDRRVLIPGDPINSKMFFRMNAEAPNNAGLGAMPQDGFLPRDIAELVEQWIRAGALNN